MLLIHSVSSLYQLLNRDASLSRFDHIPGLEVLLAHIPAEERR
jgi:hypothetical protein